MPRIAKSLALSRLSICCSIGLMVCVGTDRQSIAAEGAEAALARQILEATNIQGGLIVHIGCGGGKLTAALRAGESYLVHGLDTDTGRVTAARRYLNSLAVYGGVSVDRFDGRRLPYADSLVNLVVADDLGGVAIEEVMRVLAPGGTAYVRQGVQQEGVWNKTIKSWPAEIDQWTHWLHDAGNNPVAHDTQVGPPRRMQWVVEPLWSRGHEVPSSVGACVTARGRIFYVIDEGQPGVYSMPARWTLVARDAFNGVLLWKRPLPEWGSPQQTGGFHSGFRPRRLVTDGERLYLPTGEQDVLTVVDATDGKTLAMQEKMPGTEEILCCDGLMIAVVHPPADAARKGRPAPAAIVGMRADSLDVLWKAPISGLIVETTAMAGGRVFYATGQTVRALDGQTGRELWRADFDNALPEGKRGGGRKLLVDGRVVCFRGNAGLYAFSADSGEMLWQNRGLGGDLFAADGLMWLVRGDNIMGLDPQTGKAMRSINASAVFSQGHHPQLLSGQGDRSLHHHAQPRRRVHQRHVRRTDAERLGPRQLRLRGDAGQRSALRPAVPVLLLQRHHAHGIQGIGRRAGAQVPKPHRRRKPPGTRAGL